MIEFEVEDESEENTCIPSDDNTRDLRLSSADDAKQYYTS